MLFAAFVCAAPVAVRETSCGYEEYEEEYEEEEQSEGAEPSDMNKIKSLISEYQSVTQEIQEEKSKLAGTVLKHYYVNKFGKKLLTKAMSNLQQKVEQFHKQQTSKPKASNKESSSSKLVRAAANRVKASRDAQAKRAMQKWEDTANEVDEKTQGFRDMVQPVLKKYYMQKAKDAAAAPLVEKQDSQDVDNKISKFAKLKLKVHKLVKKFHNSLRISDKKNLYPGTNSSSTESIGSRAESMISEVIRTSHELEVAQEPKTKDFGVQFPPPVDESSSSSAEEAEAMRQTRAIADQHELALEKEKHAAERRKKAVNGVLDQFRYRDVILEGSRKRLSTLIEEYHDTVVADSDAENDLVSSYLDHVEEENDGEHVNQELEDHAGSFEETRSTLEMRSSLADHFAEDHLGEEEEEEELPKPRPFDNAKVHEYYVANYRAKVKQEVQKQIEKKVKAKHKELVEEEKRRKQLEKEKREEQLQRKKDQEEADRLAALQRIPSYRMQICLGLEECECRGTYRASS